MADISQIRILQRARNEALESGNQASINYYEKLLDAAKLKYQNELESERIAEEKYISENIDNDLTRTPFEIKRDLDKQKELRTFNQLRGSESDPEGIKTEFIGLDINEYNLRNELSFVNGSTDQLRQKNISYVEGGNLINALKQGKFWIITEKITMERINGVVTDVDDYITSEIVNSNSTLGFKRGTDYLNSKNNPVQIPIFEKTENIVNDSIHTVNTVSTVDNEKSKNIALPLLAVALAFMI